MEFWGVEVKSGEPLKVVPGDGMLIHLSQVCLGELKREKANESVYLFLNIDGSKLVLGTLVADKFPQQQFDLVFDRDFELSHNLKTGSVYFYGYKAENPFERKEEESGEDDSSSDEDIPLNNATNGKPEPMAKQEKLVEAKTAVAAKEKESNAGKQKGKIGEASKDAKPQEDDDSSSSDDSLYKDYDMDTSEDSDVDDSSDSSYDSSDDSSDEETPKKVETSKKRPLEPATTKTPVPEKKAKETPQKTDGKKGSAHVDTPHPGKQAAKTPANKPNQQTPKSAGAHSCNSCDRKFGSEKALESHSKAKHSAAK